MTRECTVSERLFLQYCHSRGFEAEKIPVPQNSGRFPDYKVTTPTGVIIVEIKEFSPNREDLLFAAQMEKRGKAGFSREIGKRVRKAIIDAAPQLRRYKNSPFPELLLLYDNTAAASTIADYLDPLDLTSGMFGEPVIRFWRDPAHKPAGASDAGHGGGRQLTETTRKYIGALGVMKRDKTTAVYIDLYHNPFSDKPVWPRYFLDPSDHHYVKSGHPNDTAWAWDEFVGDRRTT